MKKTLHISSKLRAGTALQVLALAGALAASPAFAQDAPQDAPTTVADDQATEDEGEGIVVTGTLFKTNTETPSPVTVLSAESLEQRGINTVAEAVQRVSANGAGTITQGWNTGSNFASGANAPSLRGLTVQSTLTLFDGLRMAPYPLADDGHRNFVDLNTIPYAIIERIDVLRDGASSTYGADAVAGVINVITKKEIQGIHLDGSAGVSQRGDAGEQRVSATFGYGDLEEQGFNAYINAEYQRSDELMASDRGYPFNSSDLSGICQGDSQTVCMSDLRQFGVSRNGALTTGTTTVPLVRPYNATGTAAQGVYRILNTADGCRNLDPVTLTPTQQNAGTAAPVYAAQQCQQDLRKQYSMLLPRQERLGFAARFTANIGDRAQAYAMANWYQTRTYAQLSPLNFANQTTPPGAVVYSPVFLPIYVCSAGTLTPTNTTNNGCNAQNGVLNPNNPFAANGQLARVLYRYDRPRTVETESRALRGVIGINGSFGDDWNYAVEATASQDQLDVVQNNYLVPQRLMDVIADGSFNFVNPAMNSEEIRNYIAPRNFTRSVSDLWQVSATLSKALFELPGGSLQAAVGVAYRHESINNPSANPQNDAHPFDRYYSINAVGAEGSRNVRSAYFEVNAPIIEQLELNVSGRYDDYSSGQSNFSPKIGAKFTPIPQFAVRGTFSKGFRIPSFNEAYGLPTTGYVTFQLDPDVPSQAAFIAAHGGNSYATGPYSVGLTATGNPALDPERSTSWTVGAIVEPTSGVNFTVDYWNIKVKDLIGGVDYSGIPDLYYENNGVVNIPGVVVRPQLADPSFPNALPLLGFIEYSFENNNEQRVQGIDLGANVNVGLGSGIKLFSSAEASYLIKFEKDFGGGNIQRYDGTLSPCDVTSCSGAPKWRANWQNTLDFGDATLSATVYYTSGYDLASTDYGGVKGDCEANVGASVVTYTNGDPVLCKADATWNVDLSGSVKVEDHFTLYFNVMNVLDLDPPFDPSAAYSIFQYNPAWAGPNILGRYFRVGAKVDF